MIIKKIYFNFLIFKNKENLERNILSIFTINRVKIKTRRQTVDNHQPIMKKVAIGS